MRRNTLLVLALLSSVSLWATERLSDAEVIQAQLSDYLFNAARSGDVDILDEFIRTGYDLNISDANGFTALILAAYNGHLNAVEQLLGAGADPCQSDKRGNTALLGAIFKGELSIARRLLNTECNPDQRNTAGQTPAMYAALFQRREILEALSARGANLEAQDQLGNSVENLSRGEFRTR